MNAENPLPIWARQILIGIGAFIAGGLIAFGYSYRPLHGALSWKVEVLETRLDERNRENLLLSDELAALRSSDSTRIEPEALEQVEAELKKTKNALAQAEKAADRAERKRKEASSSAANWRKRYETLRDRPEPAPPVAARMPEVSQPARNDAAGNPDARSRATVAAPAAPAPLPVATGTHSPDSSERGIFDADDPPAPFAP